MINFIHKLKHLPERYMMNSVLENFTILQVRRADRCRDAVQRRVPLMVCLTRALTPTVSHAQVVTNRDTQETLLCIAYVFEVSASDHGAQHHIYRLVKE